MNKHSKILVTGSTGLVGGAIVAKLKLDGYKNVLCPTRDDLNLIDGSNVDSYFDKHKPAYVFNAAGTVGGILSNVERPVDHLTDNIFIAFNVLRSASYYGVNKLLYLGSSCIYPKMCPQPIKEKYLLSGLLEDTNKPYAIAKIAGVLACDAYRKQESQDFISAMPTNLYGPGDNFSGEYSHVIPGLIKKLYSAIQNGEKELKVWGTGTVRREFMHVHDLADACIFLMNNYSQEGPINVGVGKDVSIKTLVNLILDAAKCDIKVVYDNDKPDGTPQKLLDSSMLFNMGWSPRIKLYDGIESTWKWYCDFMKDR